MKHEKTKTEKNQQTTHTHTDTHNGSILCVWLPFSLFVYSARFAYAFASADCLPACRLLLLLSLFLFLFYFISLFIRSYLGIFLKSAFLFAGFGVNQISNNFSTPSKKCGLLMVSFSAIVWIREFSILIYFRFSFLVQMDSSLNHLFSVVTLLECQSVTKIFNRAFFSFRLTID